ncbi:MAG: hypothetical protein DRR19_07705 [Candidatus Parabeggiatoa sp. nov. 1]|nr:MAG: hypothetical protein DRR19_07705 [Gammaproteobacteria bacterium]
MAPPFIGRHGTSTIQLIEFIQFPKLELLLFWNSIGLISKTRLFYETNKPRPKKELAMIYYLGMILNLLPITVLHKMKSGSITSSKSHNSHHSKIIMSLFLASTRSILSYKYLIGIFLFMLLTDGIAYTGTLITGATNRGDSTTTDTITTSTETDASTSYKVKIKLPHQFIEMVNGAGLELLDNMRLAGCENVCLQKSPVEADTFLAMCDKPPIALIINGFRAIHYFTLDSQTHTITFSPENLITEINISTNRTYYFASLHQTRAIVDNQTLLLSYQEIGQDLHFRPQLFSSKPQRCNITKRISLAEVMQKRFEQTPLQVQCSEITINYNEDYAVYQFPNKTACHEGINFTRLSRYTQAELQAIDFTPGTYIKLFDELNGKPVSRCTQPIWQQNKWQLDFEPYECKGKRQLIIVSTSEQLDNYGRQIPRTILNVFQNQLHLKNPFTLITIQPGRKLSKPLLRCEDMADLEESKVQRFIWQRLKDIRFGARDLRALQDLDLVNAVYTKEQLQSVLYLTDNSNIPADINHINDKDLSVPLITWKRAGIQLTVLTIGSCTPWTEKAEAECHALNSKKAVKQIQWALQDFLEEK